MDKNKKVFTVNGEPIISTFSPKFMISKLKEIGFGKIDEIDENTVKQYEEKYSFNRTDGLEFELGMKGLTLIRARIQRE